ncbi:sporulation protein [Domibacillus sp. PGB-M46]|uniref:sporulation protein n=1 Tax=Domibacillus sp. PGB-M46 TaxID=2910255 RepID=UPI001F5AABA5|nr:sporulation protein [Domibacillus sp. PGB-M46]MCI2254764.1 sporulation protein [Domibacillus sp. PGB-M46]
MALFNKALASIGIGNAKVDTKLERTKYTAGDVMRGVVEVKGGNVAQQVDSIYVSVMTTYVRETDDRKVVEEAAVVKEKLNEPFTINPGEVREFPLQLTLPYETPVTQGKTRVWVATGLDIKQAVDPADKDYIDVHPTVMAEEVLDGVRALGFRLREVECEHARLTKYPFVQEFEFVPVTGEYAGKLDELEVSFLQQSKEEVEILLQVDRRARGLGGFLSEAMGTDETNIRLRISRQQLSGLRKMLDETIRRFA